VESRVRPSLSLKANSDFDKRGIIHSQGFGPEAADSRHFDLTERPFQYRFQAGPFASTARVCASEHAVIVDIGREPASARYLPRQEACAETYRHTPHGMPVDLKHDSD
jgi:hypothetical protein